jgi:hypothetical protein
LPGKGNFAVENRPVADAREDGGLDEAGHAACDTGFQLERFAGEDCALNFYGANRG